MKKINVVMIFILLSISLSESYIPKIESSRALSFISSYGENGSESFGVVSQNLMYNVNSKMEFFGNITLQMPMRASSIYQQRYENNFNGTLNLGAKYNLSGNTSITFQYLYSAGGMSPYNSKHHLELMTR